ncbi:MAG TPA: gamma-glutamyl-gamma-aminobutyrate hydrolase family protein [Devosiaceae bacterium]
MTNKPLIGVIACNREVEGEPAQTVKARYVEGVAQFADAIPVILPSLGRPEDAPDIVARLDAILLTGSASNIEPHHYGATAGRTPHDAPRDETAMALVRAAIAANVPVFGICRGLQEINVALGGTLDDQRDREAGDLSHHAIDGVPLDEMFSHYHPVDIAPGSRLSQVTGARSVQVNSVHYQSIARLGVGLEAEARAPDGVIEAVSSTRGGGVFAVQWHPEWRPRERAHDLAFWRHVGQTARDHAARRAGNRPVRAGS